jgi:hypothetical protein
VPQRASPRPPNEQCVAGCGSSSAHDVDTYPHAQGQRVPHPDGASAQSSRLPRGLILVVAGAGMLVAALAIRQFAAIVAPVLLALVLVIAVHPLTGILRRRGLPMWLAFITRRGRLDPYSA